MGAPHRVTDIASLQEVLSLRRGAHVAVALPGFAVEESHRLEGRLNRLLCECGCGYSACALMATVAGCGVFDTTHRATLGSHLVTTLGANLVLCFAAAGLGRAAGLLRAKWRLARTVRTVRFRLALADVEEGGEFYALRRRTVSCPDA
jgi:hypothetical protein